ncbi:MAG: hypothetical protein AAGH72_00695 [Verrucomicrobiota bacterium]
MQRLVFTLITVVLLFRIATASARAEDDLPVLDVSTETEAVVEETTEESVKEVTDVAGMTEAAVEATEETLNEAEEAAEMEIEKAFQEGGESRKDAEENTGKADTAAVNDYVLQGDWDLSSRMDDKVVIRKIYEFLNDPQVTKFGKEKSIEYEFKYFNHGAITKAQRYNREGQYYVVTWTNKGEPADYQLRIDYRQSKTRDKINTITIPYQNAEGTFKGTFSITGDHYYMYGSILSWRISLVRDGVIVAQKKSFVW